MHVSSRKNWFDFIFGYLPFSTIHVIEPSQIKKMRFVCAYVLFIVLMHSFFPSMLECTESKSIAWRTLLCYAFTLCNIYLFICFLFQHECRWCTSTHTLNRTYTRTQPINTLWLLIVCCLYSLYCTIHFLSHIRFYVLSHSFLSFQFFVPFSFLLLPANLFHLLFLYL